MVSTWEMLSFLRTVLSAAARALLKYKPEIAVVKIFIIIFVYFITNTTCYATAGMNIVLLCFMANDAVKCGIISTYLETYPEPRYVVYLAIRRVANPEDHNVVYQAARRDHIKSQLIHILHLHIRMSIKAILEENM